MSDAENPFWLALQLMLRADPELVEIVLLSLQVSGSAVLLATLLGMPLGGALATLRFPGRGGVVTLLSALMGLPPVVAGLAVLPAGLLSFGRSSVRAFGQDWRLRIEDDAGARVGIVTRGLTRRAALPRCGDRRPPAGPPRAARARRAGHPAKAAGPWAATAGGGASRPGT